MRSFEAFTYESPGRVKRENAGKFTNKYLNFYILNKDFAAGEGNSRCLAEYDV